MLFFPSSSSSVEGNFCSHIKWHTTGVGNGFIYYLEHQESTKCACLILSTVKRPLV